MAGPTDPRIVGLLLNGRVQGEEESEGRV
jgi:hypothetical protein